jgi:hypothetical protein
VENINSSFITLVPKTASPEKINDFRPISLTNTGVKFLSKMVADRLQLKMVSCVHKNQYGFIKGRTIHDCLGWSFEYLHQCKMSKREIVVLKLDFEKAFDSIEHEALYLVLRRMGFPELFISWAKNLLETGTSAVLVNGVPGRNFRCKRGVRQGDPLSPLLFVLGAELLQYIINDLKDRGLLQLPIPIQQQDFPIVQYADDTLMIMPADSGQLIHLKEIMQTFSESTGHHVNYHKTTLVPINIDNARATELANIFGCRVESLPFAYLGLPLGTTRPSVSDLMPMVSRIDKKLSGISS